MLITCVSARALIIPLWCNVNRKSVREGGVCVHIEGKSSDRSSSSSKALKNKHCRDVGETDPEEAVSAWRGKNERKRGWKSQQQKSNSSMLLQWNVSSYKKKFYKIYLYIISCILVSGIKQPWNSVPCVLQSFLYILLQQCCYVSLRSSHILSFWTKYSVVNWGRGRHFNTHTLWLGD